jgi:phosphoglycolate phosphatase
LYKHKKNILFDLDGTIIESKEGIAGCITETLTHFGYTPPTKLDWCIGPPLHDVYRQLINNSDESHIEEVVAYNRKIYSEKWIYECSLFAGIIDVITHLHRDKQVFIATSKPREFAERTMEHLGINHYFKKVYGSEFDGSLENKSQLIAHILKNEQINASDCIFIGDRKYDIIGAKDNNMEVIAVTWGFAGDDEFTEHKPSHICHHVLDLINIL